MRKIFVHCFLNSNQKKYLKKNFFIKVHDANERILLPDELLNYASGYDGIICQGNCVSNKYIEKNKSILKVISNVSVGYDNVDVEFATKHKIAIFNTPSILDDTVADLTIGLLISVARKICEGNNFVKSGKWKKNSWPLFLGEDLKNEFLGIIGMGNIGKKVAERANAFNLKILYNNRNKLGIEEENKYMASYCSLEQLLRKSKYVVILAPLNKQTKHLMNERTFSMMRRDAFIINIARGKIINENDLVKALEKKIIAGAGLDVFEFEPAVNSKLLKMNNTVLMPHAGSASYKTRNQMVELACKNISDYLLYNLKKNLINKKYI